MPPTLHRGAKRVFDSTVTESTATAKEGSVMGIDAVTPRSRRGLLVSATAAAGAAAAAFMGRPLPARGGATPVYLGVSGQTAAATTEVVATGADAFSATSTAANRVGVIGYNSATTGETFGVMGHQTSNNDGSAVYGQADDGGAGVFGLSSNIYVASPMKTGVYGRTTLAGAAARGVWGESDLGSGLYGTTTSGYALETVGRLKLGTSGVATIGAGQAVVVVPVGVDVTAGSFVLLSPKVNLAGRDLWWTIDQVNDTITIRISSSRTTATKISWLLLG